MKHSTGAKSSVLTRSPVSTFQPLGTFAEENPSAAAIANPHEFVDSECGSDGDTPSIPRYAMRSASAPSIITRLTLGCLPWPLADWHPSVPLVIEQTWNRGHDSVWVFECSRARRGAFMDV